MAANPVPPGHDHIIPHLVVRGAAEAIAWYIKALGAKEIARMPFPDSKAIMHAELRIGHSILLLADEFPGSDCSSPSQLKGTSVSLTMYVPDVDAAYNRAIQAGAKSIAPPVNMFWGDRYSKLTDPFGHSWALLSHVEDMSHDEMAKRGQEFMKNMKKG